ncbi:MAG: TetR/AcrR family transcriptional regulator [Bryobacteraceae bacterium]
MVASPTRHRLPAAQRRAAIVDAAMDLFSKNGFRGTTTKQLAAACGISEPVLYQHFETKQALYDAIIEGNCDGEADQLIRQMEEMAAGDDSRMFFGALASGFLDFYLDDPRFARLLMFSNLEGHELAERFYEKRVAIFYGWVTRHLERQMAAGRMKKVNPLVAARAFAGMIAHQGMIYAIYCPGELPVPRNEVVETVVDLFLGGIQA